MQLHRQHNSHLVALLRRPLTAPPHMWILPSIWDPADVKWAFRLCYDRDLVIFCVISLLSHLLCRSWIGTLGLFLMEMSPMMMEMSAWMPSLRPSLRPGMPINQSCDNLRLDKWVHYNNVCSLPPVVAPGHLAVPLRCGPHLVVHSDPEKLHHSSSLTDLVSWTPEFRTHRTWHSLSMFDSQSSPFFARWPPS